MESAVVAGAGQHTLGLLARADTWNVSSGKAASGLLVQLQSGIELMCFEGEAVRGTSPQVVFGRDEGGVDTAAEALAERGAPVLTPVTEAPGSSSVEFKCPDGHGLAYFQDGALPRRL